jgi:hypothetical protein
MTSDITGTNSGTNTGDQTNISGNAATATSLQGLVGTAPSYSARAWVNFNGTGTVAIRASGNVSSITDNGVGDYTVNFTTALPDVNYSIVFGTTAATAAFITRQLAVAGSDTTTTLLSTSQVRITRGDTASSNLVDGVLNSVTIFR